MSVNDVAPTGTVTPQMTRFTCECGTHVATESGSETDAAQRCHRCRRRNARLAPNETLTRPSTA